VFYMFLLHLTIEIVVFLLGPVFCMFLLHLTIEIVVFLLGPVFCMFLLHLTIEIVVFYTTAGQMLMVVCRAEQLLSLL
jgi:hypothetical protein